MQIKKVPTKDLISPEWNPRQITTEELEKLKTSLEEFGYIEPIIVNDVNNHVVGGNQRLRALIALGYDEVDCVYVHIEDINKEKACNVALNKISGDWDEDKLRVVLEDIELSPIDIRLTGFEELELTELEITTDEPVEVVEDDYNEPDDLEVTVQQGDVYLLGNHRLMCGDSTKKEDINLLIDDNKIHMILTDPPYHMYLDSTFGGMSYNPNAEYRVKKDYKKVMGDNDDFTDDLILNLFKIDAKEMFLFGADYYSDLIPNKEKGSWLVWDKRTGLEDMEWTTSEFELCYSKNKHHRKILRHTWHGLIGLSSEDLKQRVHPTQKPVKLIADIMDRWSENKDNILDLYGGSGSTLIACEQLNRQCYMMELDPYYCQVIINRWEEYTGRKAEKLPL